jgi:hypothetical protein
MTAYAHHELPPPCIALSLVPGGGQVKVTAEANKQRSPQAIGALHLFVRVNGRSVSSAEKERIRDVVLTARTLESALQTRCDVALQIEATLINATWPWLAMAALNAVLADRALRGVWSAPLTITLGQCDESWPNPRLLPLPAACQRAGLEALKDATDLGAVCLVLPPPADTESQVLHEAIRTRHGDLDYFEVGQISNLSNAASGGGHLRCATVHFPAVGVEGKEEMLPLTIKLRPVGTSAEAVFDITGLDSARQGESERLSHLLTAIRAKDSPQRSSADPRYWYTLISLPPRPFDGHSFELALVVADRIARGRDFPMPGGRRLLATGVVTVSEPSPSGLARGEDAGFVNVGRVHLKTDTLAQKGALLLREAMPGERVLIPGHWREEFSEWQKQLQGKGVSVACVGNVLALG